VAERTVASGFGVIIGDSPDPRDMVAYQNADCGMPVGAFSKVTNGKIELIISTDCKKTISGSADIKDRFNLAKRLVSELWT